MPRRNNGPRLRWGNPRRPAEKNPVWWIVWTERGRSRERSTGAVDRTDAQVQLADFLKAQPGNAGPRDPSEVLVVDVLADYALERAAEVRAAVRLGCAVAALTPFWQGRRVQDVTKATCAAYARSRGRYFMLWSEGGQQRSRCAFAADRAEAERELDRLVALRPNAKPRELAQLPTRAAQLQLRPLKAGSVRRELTVLRAAINAAHREGRLTRPVAVELPATAPPRDRFLTRSEVARLIVAARRDARTRLHLPLFILLGVYTGRRKEALLSLRWPFVDLRDWDASIGGTIDFRRPGEAETKKRRGRIQIPRALRVHLRHARKRGADMGFVLNRDGDPIGDIKRSFATACRRAGLEGVTPHTLKHTCATWLMQAGVDKWVAAGYLATSFDTLERVYGHHHPDHFSAAGDALSSRPRNVRGIAGSKGTKPALTAIAGGAGPRGGGAA